MVKTSVEVAPTASCSASRRLLSSCSRSAGWPAEAKRVSEGAGLGPSAVQALGYDAALRVAKGEVSAADAHGEIALRTRQFARRQRTWFRKFDIDWVDPRDGDVVSAITARMRSAR